MGELGSLDIPRSLPSPHDEGVRRLRVVIEREPRESMSEIDGCERMLPAPDWLEPDVEISERDEKCALREGRLKR